MHKIECIPCFEVVYVCSIVVAEETIPACSCLCIYRCSDRCRILEESGTAEKFEDEA